MFTDDARIFYTIDGQEPSTEAFLYEGPIKIDETTVIRAKAYKGKKRSKIKSSTFFINEPKSWHLFFSTWYQQHWYLA